ncbi:MAG: hypothetical protein LBC77_01335 [Spirochaetaceae bacterium]|jgi:hypothetical protein|nr:hypothetical protein [Spirochaetaceae bacterium]
MRFVFPAAVLVTVFFLSCGSTDTKSNDHVEAVRAKIAAGKTPAFNPASITKEQKETVRLDANKFVAELNRYIQQRNYTAWIRYLEPKYKQWLESRENLEQASLSDRLSQQHIVLQNLLDYFINVVVPSRNNLRVDDIEFVSENRVKTFMIEKGQRLRIYELERYGDSWRIVK